MSTQIDSLKTAIPFTDFVEFVEVTDKKGTRRTLRTTDKIMPKGIYQLYLPKFGVLYMGISGTHKQTQREGVKNRLYAHAQKMTGQFKGASDTQMFKEFREQAQAKGYTLDTILDYVRVYFFPCEQMDKSEIEAWETILFNSLSSKGQCQFNTAKRIEGLDYETVMFVLNQEYLKDTAQYYV